MTEKLRPFDRLGEKQSTDLRNTSHIRQVGEVVVLTSYDEKGILIGESALPMKPMFNEEQLIEAGFLVDSSQ